MGVPDLARGMRVKAEGGICLAKDSRDVFENSEGVGLPRSVEPLFPLVSLRLKMDLQLLESRALVSESRRWSSGRSGISGVLLDARYAMWDTVDGSCAMCVGDVGGDILACDMRTALAVSSTGSSGSSVGVGASR